MDRNRLIRITLVLGVMGAVAAASIAVAASRGGSGSGLVSAEGISGGAIQGLTAGEEQRGAPWLGVMLTMTPEGVTVAQVIADSPADSAGLKRGDVIQAVDGSDVSRVKDVQDAIGGKSAGDEVTLKISRDGADQDVRVTLADRPAPLLKENPLFPELNGITRDEIFSHMLSGQFIFTDADGNEIAATAEAGTVASVDSGGGKLSVNLNDGSSKTYDVTDQHVRPGGSLSDLSEGDKVVVLTVDGDVRAVIAGGHFPLMPGLAGVGGRFGRGRHGGFGQEGFRHGGAGWSIGPEISPPASVQGGGA